MAGAVPAEIERLFGTGAHFAQAKSRRHPSMKGYLVGTKGRQEIIDLAETARQLEEAKAAMTTLAREGKTVLFVGGKTEIAGEVAEVAGALGAPYVAGRWLGGTISNWPEIKKRIERLAALSDERAGGAAARTRTKLELVRQQREEERLGLRLGGIITLTKRPDALVVVDTRRERYAVKEAKDARIPIIAIMSSDCDLASATYPVVANDASKKTVRFVLDELALAFEAGRKG
jgi:small subunit ribosomal protein S2